jgi:hypothetical protein
LFGAAERAALAVTLAAGGDVVEMKRGGDGDADGGVATVGGS